jgi:hypothetical protein
MKALRRSASGPWLVVVVCWALAVGGRLIKHGGAFGLNYALYQPDGNRYIGLSRALLHGNLAGQDRITVSRPLYSILSLPFYAVLGDRGMLVVPALSLLVVGLCILAIAREAGVPWVGVAAFGLLTMSVTVNRWMIADITDAPHAAIFAIGCLLLYRGFRFWPMALLLVLGLLARPAGPAWIALFIPFLLRAKGAERRHWLVLGSLAATVTALTLILVPDVSGFDPTGSVTWSARLLRLPERMVTIPAVELGELAVLDRLLLLFILAALVLAWRNRHALWPQVYLWVLGVTMLMGAWNGVYGVNFRYQLPVLVPAAVVVIEWAAKNRVERAFVARGTEGNV